MEKQVEASFTEAVFELFVNRPKVGVKFQRHGNKDEVFFINVFAELPALQVGSGGDEFFINELDLFE